MCRLFVVVAADRHTRYTIYNPQITAAAEYRVLLRVLDIIMLFFPSHIHIYCCFFYVYDVVVRVV